MNKIYLDKLRKEAMDRNANELEEAMKLISTSVEDMQSSLGCNNYSVAVLHWANHFAARRGERTKANILARKIKKITKENAINV